MTTKQIQNTFAQRSEAYAVARPRYPRELYDWLLSQAVGREAVWDCATGNGQAAVDLAPFFTEVQATDISGEQISEGLAGPNINYSTQPAERTEFKPDSFDLVTVAQALHWFDFARFWPELSRVSKSGGLFCAWGYAWFKCDEDADAMLVQPVRELIFPYWAPNNRILWRGYLDEDIAFPFKRLHAPAFNIDVQWTAAQLIDYMQTWSSYKRAQQNEGVAQALRKIVDQAIERFAPRTQFNIKMPLSIVAGHVTKG